MKSKLFLATLAVVGVTVLAMTYAESASASFSFSVDASTGIFGPEGTTAVLGTHDVDPGLVGVLCHFTIDVHNNDSVRQGTDVLVQTGSVTFTAANVEGVAGDAPPALLGDAELGDTITVSVRFGPKAKASLGATIEVDCPDVPTTTSTTTTTTTTTLAPNPPAPTVSPAVVVRPAVQVAGVVVAQPGFTG